MITLAIYFAGGIVIGCIFGSVIGFSFGYRRGMLAGRMDEHRLIAEAASGDVRLRARNSWRHWDRDEIEHELKAPELIVELNADQAAQLEQAIEERAADPNAPMRVLFEDEPPAVKVTPSSQGGSS